MAADDLSAPLGQDTSTQKRCGSRSPSPQAIVAGLARPSVAVFAAWAMIADDPLGGEPMAVVATDLARPAGARRPTRSPAVRDARRPPAPAAAPPGARRQRRRAPQTVTIIDGTSGKRQEVRDPAAAAGRTSRPPTSTQRLRRALAPRPIPKIAPDGARPASLCAPGQGDRRQAERAAHRHRGRRARHRRGSTADALASCRAR